MRRSVLVQSWPALLAGLMMASACDDGGGGENEEPPDPETGIGPTEPGAPPETIDGPRCDFGPEPSGPPDPNAPPPPPTPPARYMGTWAECVVADDANQAALLEMLPY